MRIILWETSYIGHSNNIQAAVWNYRSLIAKTFDRNILKMKAACKSWGNKEQKTIFLVVSQSDAHFGFARPLFTCPASAQLKLWSWWDVLKTGPKPKCTSDGETTGIFFFCTLFWKMGHDNATFCELK